MEHNPFLYLQYCNACRVFCIGPLKLSCQDGFDYALPFSSISPMLGALLFFTIKTTLNPDYCHGSGCCLVCISSWKVAWLKSETLLCRGFPLITSLWQSDLVVQTFRNCCKKTLQPSWISMRLSLSSSWRVGWKTWTEPLSQLPQQDCVIQECLKLSCYVPEWWGFSWYTTCDRFWSSHSQTVCP